MRMLKSLSLLVSGVCLAQSAYAAGWSHNFYGGLGGGWQEQNFNSEVGGLLLNFKIQNAPQSFGSSSANNAFGNAFIGLANTNGSLYWAVEGDVYYNNINDTSTYVEPYQDNLPVTFNYLQTQMKWRYELDFILGHFFTPRWLGYAKIGATTGELESQVNVNGSAHIPIANSPTASAWTYGGVVGLGAQYYVTSHWRVGAEADYMEFARTNMNINSSYYSGAVPTQFTVSTRPQGYFLKAMVSYVF